MKSSVAKLGVGFLLRVELFQHLIALLQLELTASLTSGGTAGNSCKKSVTWMK